MFYDPIENSERESNISLSKFRKFLKNLGGNYNHVSRFQDAPPLSLKLQNDGHSCGIFVIHVIIKMDRGKDVADRFNEIKSRVDLIEEILSTSDSMEDVCLYCGESSVYTSWVQCYNCKRRVHQECTTITKSQEDWEKDDFICDFCMKKKQ